MLDFLYRLLAYFRSAPSPAPAPAAPPAMSGPNFTSEQQAVLQDFRVSIGGVFKSLYDEKWNDDLWTKSICTIVDAYVD